MNQNIRMLNGGKDHKPIFKVRKAEILGMKFAVGERGHKDKKWVEADKGTNLFFAIYESEENKRSYSSIPLNEAIDTIEARRKHKLMNEIRMEINCYSFSHLWI